MLEHRLLYTDGPTSAPLVTDKSVNFDTVLTPEQAARFGRLLDTHPELLASESAWSVCSLCNIPRFQGPVGSSLGDFGHFLDPFSQANSSPLSATSCCSQFICDTCNTNAITSSILRDWWHNLGSENWLRCPVQSCNAALPLHHKFDLTVTLSSLPEKQALEYVAQFVRANRLRSILESISPAPTVQTLRRAADLHTNMERHGRMHNALDLRQAPCSKIEMLPVDSADGSQTLQLPIFVDLLIRPGSKKPSSARSSGRTRGGRECVVCTETLHDVTDGTQEDEARWAAAIADIPGDWTWKIRSFPPPSALPDCSASHPLNICRPCLARHLTTQLESRGRASLDVLACPTPGCSHVYSPNELRILMPPATYAKYDQLRLFGHLATLPDFRWCLRPGCGMGQVHYFPPMPNFGGDAATIPQRSRVVCDACGFAMCFRHQSGWHEGQSCLEVDAARGDPQLRATHDWIQRHTKPCPGMCGAAVEKQGGCFHMRCQVCRFEFCWECLADWTRIVRVHPVTRVRRYSRAGHNPGCFFKAERAPEARMLMGNTVAEALEAVGGWR
ncbi:hypothetical protein B0H67DRAFT_648357 [Lasiosphaeris hirsuta]|uniref:RBR-type E3 ubiquitin transferase n=1 Tax=Lasiosphaeris hirsuta TaxID=260670 RepID=A0AA40A2U9_9PEZI|nr:hypothetical protein B0H67DRAFT_648357 [Lasiosphaeris hirsuta]